MASQVKNFSSDTDHPNPVGDCSLPLTPVHQHSCLAIICFKNKFLTRKAYMYTCMLFCFTKHLSLLKKYGNKCCESNFVSLNPLFLTFFWLICGQFFCNCHQKNKILKSPIHQSIFCIVQGDYVLFRLFRKPEEKTGVQKYDEVEQTGLSPTKSSPDETSSNLVQEPATSDTQVEEEIEGIKRWKTDKSEDLTADAFLSVESCCNSYEASNIEDHPSMTSLPAVRFFHLFVHLYNLSYS